MSSNEGIFPNIMISISRLLLSDVAILFMILADSLSAVLPLQSSMNYISHHSSVAFALAAKADFESLPGYSE